MKKIYKLLGFLLASCLLQACADNRLPEEIVSERAQTRLDLLIEEKDLEKAYKKYTTPAYRDRTTLAYYQTRWLGTANWLEAKVSDETVSCTDDVCEMKVLVTYKVGIKGVKLESTRAMDEKWVKVDNKWYIYHR